MHSRDGVKAPTSIFNPRLFPHAPLQKFAPLPPDQQGKVYADVPYRYFSTRQDLRDYARELKAIGVNVLLLMPHFLPSFSEYVVKDYEQPAPFFGSWQEFTAFMAFVEDLGMDRMIDIPFNHADWQANHLRREWYIKSADDGEEAGADDTDADGKRVRINWGAFVLDNANPELQQYWLDKVITQHLATYHANAIRIDAAWGLDEGGLRTIVQEAKKRFPHVWFVAENLGMDRLINLARSGIEAGADRFFNNIYWYSGGRAIPSDMYRFLVGSDQLPTCTISSSHDVLTPALKCLALAFPGELGGLNDKALVRKVVQWDGKHSLKDFSEEIQNRILRLIELDFALSAFVSTDLMFAAGAERALLKKVDVLSSGPADFSLGLSGGLAESMGAMIRLRNSARLFSTEGVVIPFGAWSREEIGCRGFVRRTGDDHLLVAVNMDLENERECSLPKRFHEAGEIHDIGPDGYSVGTGRDLPASVLLPPGQGLILAAVGRGSTGSPRTAEGPSRLEA